MVQSARAQAATANKGASGLFGVFPAAELYPAMGFKLKPPPTRPLEELPIVVEFLAPWRCMKPDYDTWAGTLLEAYPGKDTRADFVHWVTGPPDGYPPRMLNFEGLTEEEADELWDSFKQHCQQHGIQVNDSGMQSRLHEVYLRNWTGY
jgi:hypothetical protein